MSKRAATEFDGNNQSEDTPPNSTRPESFIHLPSDVMQYIMYCLPPPSAVALSATSTTTREVLDDKTIKNLVIKALPSYAIALRTDPRISPTEFYKDWYEFLPNLESARIFGDEWEAWTESALASSDGRFFARVYRGLPEDDDNDDGDVYGDESGDDCVRDLVIGRMASFCAMCMESYVPNQGYVTWFKKQYKGCYSACSECLYKIPEAERPEVNFMS